MPGTVRVQYGDVISTNDVMFRFIFIVVSTNPIRYPSHSLIGLRWNGSACRLEHVDVRHQSPTTINELV